MSEEKKLISCQVSIQESNYKSVATSRQHSLISDEPTEEGGTNLGMRPTELLLASLGSCTVITLKMYAGRKGYPLTGADVQLQLIDNTIRRTIHLSGDLTDEAKTRLMEIADKCPVHKLLTGGNIKVETELKA